VRCCLFNIDTAENYSQYALYLKYEEDGKPGSVVKKLTFKDDTATKRGIRIIPRTSNYGLDVGYKEAEDQAKVNFGVGGAARVSVPTIYLSISRLYPLGERRDTVRTCIHKRLSKVWI